MYWYVAGLVFPLQSNTLLHFQTLKLMTLHAFEMLENTNPGTQHHILEDLNPQLKTSVKTSYLT